MYYSKDLVLTVVDEEGAKELYAQYNDYYGRACCDAAYSFVAPETYTNLLKDISEGGLGFLVRKRNGTVIGYASLQIDYVPRVARPYLFLGKEYRNKGYGTQLMAILIHIAFQEANSRKISLACYGLNKSGVHLYKKMGFMIEGERIDEVYREGKYWDIYYMGLFKENWCEIWKTYVTNEEGKQLYITVESDTNT